ncbi:MAG: tetratricopeptide repeat protein [bacterium]
MQKLIFLLFLNLIFSIAAYPQGGHKQVSEGNELFTEEKYDKANNKYRDALIENPESPIIHFNIGDVLYKKRNYEEAVKSYQKTLSSDDVLLQSKSYYNMGNTLYKMGKLPESILMYKKALELNPNDEDAKYNLEYVRAKLKDTAEKQPQQNQQQQQQQQDQQSEKQNQNSQEQEQQQEQQSQSEGDENQNEQDQQQELQEQAEQPQEISREDAERILDALQNEEQELLKQQKTTKKGRAFRGKDW